MDKKKKKIPDHVSKTLTIILTKQLLLIVGDNLWSFGGPLQVASEPQNAGA